MKFHHYALGTASLAATLLFAGGAFSQAADPTQYSTPAERAQTRQLNSQAASGTYTDPDQLNGAAPQDQGPQATGEQNAEQQQYQQQQAQYRAQRAQYDRDMMRYDRAEWRFADYPRPYPYRYDARLWSLYMIEDPTHQLAQAAIEGPNGEWVGKVRNVELDPAARPLRIEVALNRRVSVWVPPTHFRFDAADHILFTDLTREDLWRYPGATVESSYWP